MCLGVPGKIVEVSGEGEVRMGVVDFGGIRRRVCLAYAPEAGLGSYVVVHVGFAISVVDEVEASRSFALLRELDNLEGIELPQDAEGVTAVDPRAPHPGRKAAP